MFKHVLIFAIAVGFGTKALCAVSLPAGAPTSSSTELKKEHKKLECPQCGIWAISSANEIGIHGENVKDLNAPPGNYLFIDKHTVTIPFCGSFKYSIQTSTSKVQDDILLYELSMPLKKQFESLLCKGDDWTLKAIISSGAIDKGGMPTLYFSPRKKI